MKILNLVAAAALSVAGLSSIYAGTQAGRLEIKGTSDMSFDFVGDIEDDDGNEVGQTGFDLGIEANYFILDNLSIGAGFGYEQEVLEIGEYEMDSTTLSFLGRGDFYLAPRETVVPYVGLHLGYDSNTTDDGEDETDRTGLKYGAQLGVKYFMRENIALNCELMFSSGTAEWDETDDLTTTDLDLVLGLSVFF